MKLLIFLIFLLFSFPLLSEPDISEDPKEKKIEVVPEKKETPEKKTDSPLLKKTDVIEEKKTESSHTVEGKLGNSEKTPISVTKEFSVAKVQFRTLLLSYPGAILKNTKLVKTYDPKATGYKLAFVGERSIAKLLSLQTGDIILRFNDTPVFEKEKFFTQLDSLPDADGFSFTFIRKAEIHKYSVRILEEPNNEPISIDQFLRYYLAFDTEREILPLKNSKPEQDLFISKSINHILFWEKLKKFGYNFLSGVKYSAERDNDKLNGIRLNSVEKNSLGSRLGFQKGDRIIQVNGYSLLGIQEELLISKLEEQIYFYNYAVIDLERNGKIFRYNLIFKDKYYLTIGPNYNPVEKEIEIITEPSVEDAPAKEEQKDAGGKTHYFDESKNLYIPINSQTGTIYNEESLEQFNELRKALPGNKLIPRILSPTEYVEFAKEFARFVSIQAKIDKEKLSSSDVEFYFGILKKTLQDKLEILEYLNKLTGEFPEDVMERARAKIKSEVELLEKEKQKQLKPE